jgi:hypothetical protein|tara:strand:+ start:269 stop:541 length:273 start_codon:yes stop_codon:yes gene_type:complete
MRKGIGPKQLGSPLKQKLSPTARRDKAARDLAYANSPARKKKRAENQRLRRAAIKAGRNIEGKDFDHKDRKFKTVAANRGNDGMGTKKEG